MELHALTLVAHSYALLSTASHETSLNDDGLVFPISAPLATTLATTHHAEEGGLDTTLH